MIAEPLYKFESNSPMNQPQDVVNVLVALRFITRFIFNVCDSCNRQYLLVTTIALYTHSRG